MTHAIPIRPSLLMIPLGLMVSLAPVAVRAQTFDSTAGTAPSEKLSTPPGAAPVNQRGAMQRAYSHPPASAARHKTTRSDSRTRPAPSPQ